MTLNRNVADYHTEIEQAAFEPNNLVAGTGLSPDKMLLARGFSYADAHRARLGVNYKQIPVNSPKAEVHAYSKDGAMRVHNVADPVYAPNSYGGPQADPSRVAEPLWYADGEMVRSAYTLRQDDDDWGQAGTMVREVLDDAARHRLVEQHRRPPAQRGERAGAGPRLRVLAQRRQGPRRPHRARGAQPAVRKRSEGGRTDQPAKPRSPSRSLTTSLAATNGGVVRTGAVRDVQAITDVSGPRRDSRPRHRAS